MKYLVSSYPAGVACRYNGTASLDAKIQELVEQEEAKMEGFTVISENEFMEQLYFS